MSYGMQMLLCAVLAGVGVGAECGIYLGLAAFAATWALTPIHPYRP